MPLHVLVCWWYEGEGAPTPRPACPLPCPADLGLLQNLARPPSAQVVQQADSTMAA